ncbi:MAG: hypothetical protein WCF17_16850 [Terracidiphilus sp.]
MPTVRILTTLCLACAAAFAFAQAAPPTAYTITESVAGGVPGTTLAIHRSGSKVLTELLQPAQGATPASRTLSLYDLAAGTSLAWNPATTPPACSISRFSGDWGDPFAVVAEINPSIAKGDLKPAGAETLAGITARIYAGSVSQAPMKVWLDAKDGLVLRAVMGAAGSPAAMLVDIKSVSFASPPPSLFALPAGCAGVRPPPSAQDLIAEETGDSGANYVNGIYGPGSKNSCSVVLRVVQAKTMTPIAHIQVAIDTTYNQNNPNPPSYSYGVHDDGSQTYSGGGIREITSVAHNGTVNLGTPPAYFMLDVNVIHPGHSSGVGLVYRQCFAPTTVLLYVVKDYGQATESGDFLWVKSGKYAATPGR